MPVKSGLVCENFHYSPEWIEINTVCYTEMIIIHFLTTDIIGKLWMCSFLQPVTATSDFCIQQQQQDVKDYD